MCPAGLQGIRKVLCGGAENTFPAHAAAMLFYGKHTSMLFIISQQLLSGHNGLLKFHPHFNIIYCRMQPISDKKSPAGLFASAG
jgi:hypothetical protein